MVVYSLLLVLFGVRGRIELGDNSIQNFHFARYEGHPIKNETFSIAQ